MSSTISFGRTPAEAIEYFEKKGLKLTWDYDEMMYEAHHKAFTVAKVTKLDLLKDIQSSLSQAMKEGQNYKDWHKNIKPTLQKHGWYGKTEVFNPDTGEFKTITVGSKRLKNIFDTNMRVSYARASYKQQMGFKLAVFWRYNSMLLETTRASHRSRHGIVLPREHVWWDINYPPNDWNCKCFVTAHTAKEVEKKGWSIHAGELDNIAGKDWAYNVGINDNIQAVYQNKLAQLVKKGNDELYTVAKKEAIVNIDHFKKWFKDPAGAFLIAALHPAYKEVLGVENKEVLMTQKVVIKQQKEHRDIQWYEYLLINSMLNDADLVIQKGDDILIHIKPILGKSYFCVVRAGSDKEKAFIASYRRTNSDDIEKEIKKGKILWDKR